MRTVVALLVALGALALGAHPARADDNAVGLSYDGIDWSESLTRPLFDPEIRWVPGDERSARFYVRNEYPERGDLTIDVERAEHDALLDSGTLHIDARTGRQPWSTVDETGLQRLLATDDIATGGPVAVEVRVRMDASAPNGTMVLATDLDLRVTISDADAGAGPEGGDTPGGELPETGAAVAPWVPPLALLLLVIGGVLMAHRRQDDDPVPIASRPSPSDPHDRPSS